MDVLFFHPKTGMSKFPRFSESVNMQEQVPHYFSAGGTTTWTGINVVHLDQPFENGTYQINWILRLNTDTKGSSTITLSGLDGKVGVPVGSQTTTQTKTPCFEWQYDYEKCKDAD